MSTLIELLEEPTRTEPVEILQLYDELELLRLDRPPRHSLFVLGREPDPSQPDRLLIIDPPPDRAARFRVEGDVAILCTRADAVTDRELAAPRLEAKAGGVAHIRLGRHFLDIYTQTYYSVVHFPTLGILYTGGFGSEATVPTLAAGDDGADALETVRILAALVKARPLKLVIPRIGELGEELVPVMERLAADVAYLHHLQRIASALPADIEDAKLAELAATLLPATRRSELAQLANLQNLRAAVTSKTT